MKKFDYIVIQAPMISELGLKGNSLLLFAMIHGFSKDGVNRYRASLNDMCEWLCTSKGSICPVLDSLEKAGYINRFEDEDKVVEYTTNYDALLKKVAVEGALKPALVHKQKPIKKVSKKKGGTESVPRAEGLKLGGTESVLGTESVPREVLNPYQNGTESVPNKYINIYKYSCCYSELTEEQKEQEQKQFFKIFFFKGAADPAAEVQRFVGHNQANGWQGKSGQKFDTTEKRLGLADLWKFQLGERKAKVFLKVWKDVYSKVEALEGADVLLDPRTSFSYTDTHMIINCTRAVKEFIESHIKEVKEIFIAHASGKKIQYKFI